MSNSLRYIVVEAGQDIKIIDYMTEYLKLSGRFSKRASKEKRLMLNGKHVQLGERLKAGDVIEISEEMSETQDLTPEEMILDVIYEDSDLIVVNKPAFLLVHPTPNHPSGTLTNGLLHHFQSNGEACIVRLVSRLDRDTSGLIMAAKSSFAHMNLAKAMESNKIVKSYVAIVHGQMVPENGTIDLPIGSSLADPIKRCVCDDGQKSITHYKTISKYASGTLVGLTLETGRTHQIRVHLSHLGNPIVGDSLYGSEESSLINRQALHAQMLRFPHPRTGEELMLQCDMPKDMQELLLKINING